MVGNQRIELRDRNEQGFTAPPGRHASHSRLKTDIVP